ncbi:zinc finger E-box-binding homeobox 2 isoform X2 [Gouania willdenowi]|uniref:zinc finger E-box-binding homeobox 2 isoform X2 n=1 Tax=Gouania willdenowi TaxID=441366 RepID=UPI0010563206|nr:zinc finger E-box-binding homeobox 2-like isoform X2 [Gouania willdenowi]
MPQHQSVILRQPRRTHTLTAPRTTGEALPRGATMTEESRGTSEESRGKRRKQANPRRNRDAEQGTSLGSEGENEVALWSPEPQDCLEKTSLTLSEGTDDPGTPAHSPSSSMTCWDRVESGTKAAAAAAEEEEEVEEEEEDNTFSSTDKQEPEAVRMFCKSSDPQSAFKDLSQYDFLVQLRKSSSSAAVLDHLTCNGDAVTFRPSNQDDELPPAIWSPGANHCSPEGTDTSRTQQACPFCRRIYQRGAQLRDHVKYCQEKEGGPMICPLCGYTATLRAQMERHLVLHNQVQEKGALTLDQGMETRKFKCLQCGKAFKYKHHLKEHLRIHSGEKPYECSNCKKRFSHSGSYSSHLSSKKCLSGGGIPGTFNGHSKSSYHHSFPISPFVGESTTNNNKALGLSTHGKDRTSLFHRAAADHHHHHLQQHLQEVKPKSMADMSQLWESSAELSLKASMLKGAALMPYLRSGTKFEHMLQEMLHRGRNKEDNLSGDVEEMVHNGRGADRRSSSDSGREAGRDDADCAVFGVTCRWCSQVFPNVSVLLQHERYLCNAGREAVEVPEVFPEKDPSSPPLFFPRPQPENGKPSEATNGLSADHSTLTRPSWHTLPQQLLVAMHSPPLPPHDLLSSRMYLSRQEKESPGKVLHSSPKGRRRVSSLEFNTFSSLDLTNGPPEVPLPRGKTSSPWRGQNEPLDLSMPKALLEQRRMNKSINGLSARDGRRDSANHQLSKPSPNSHLQLHPVFSGGPMLPGHLYNGFPLFSQSGVGLSGHDNMVPIPFNQTGNSPCFPSPMAYMMEAEAEVTLKKIYQERQSLMSEALHCGALDYLSLVEDGLEGDGGPGRKRLKKTDEGLYSCDICDKTFQKSSSLLRHKYEHTGKRPHECKICNKAFKHKHHLIEHSRLHSGEKPYQCDKCGKRFSHSGSYSQHMNHRYAYCSKDQDPDQDNEDMPLTPGAGHHLLGRDNPLSIDDIQAPRIFLSDSSLDGAADGLKEEEEEEEEDRVSVRVSLTEAVEEPGGTALQKSPSAEYGVQSPGNMCDVGIREKPIWKRGAETQNNGDLDKCELSLDITELPRIKT